MAARSFAAIKADTLAAKQECKAAGVTHCVIEIQWDSAQPEAGALNAAHMDARCQEIIDCGTVGLKPILAVNAHYPEWATVAIEQFKDQSGFLFDTNGSGTQVRNWIWQQAGRDIIEDFTLAVGDYLGPLRARIDRVRVGLGGYGEAHYPRPTAGGAPTPAWWAYGASMQAGTDIATGLDPCPLPGYVVGDGTDAQDSVWLNWYINGLVTATLWHVELHKASGLTCDLHVLIPGFGVRSNHDRASDSYREQASRGEDPLRMIAAIANDPQVWPWSTWINGTDASQNLALTADRNAAAWRKVYRESALRGKHWHLWGENTGNEDNAGMDAIFDGGALDTIDYPGATPNRGYVGLMWLDYDRLKAGGANATIENLAARIATCTPIPD